VCVESKTAECTKMDPCKILAIDEKILSPRINYSREFRHRNIIVFSGELSLLQAFPYPAEHPSRLMAKRKIVSLFILFSGTQALH
jgi:hypothetical protein